MKNLKKTIALVCILLLLFAVMPAAFADLESLNPDREFVNPDNECVAAIYDAGGFFTEEEKDRLLEQMRGCTDWFDIFIVTDHRQADEITEDPEFLNICSGYHLALIFGSERKDMRAQWAFSSGEGTEDEALAPDEVAAIFSNAKGEYLNSGSAFDAAIEFAENLLAALQESGAAPAEVQQDNKHYYFKTLEDLQEILAMDTENEILVSGTVDRDYTIKEDIIIPTGKTVFFGEGIVTVEPGVTLTVEEYGGLFFYGLDVQGTVVNNGDLVQCEVINSSDQLPIRIEGKVINNDWFSFRKIAEGMEKIENTDDGTLFSVAEGKSVSPASSSLSPSSTPAQKPSGSTGSAKKSTDSSSVAAYVLIGITLILILIKNPDLLEKLNLNKSRTNKTGATSRQKQTKRPVSVSSRTGETAARRPAAYRPEVYNPKEYSYNPADYSETDYMAHDSHRRMKQLDDWLKSGLIDKDEYRKLKDLYSGKQ